MTNTDIERYSYDVVVIGAGGAGLRAAVEAREAGFRVAIICKSLFGKAHTVMVEGDVCGQGWPNTIPHQLFAMFQATFAIITPVANNRISVLGESATQ